MDEFDNTESRHKFIVGIIVGILIVCGIAAIVMIIVTFSKNQNNAILTEYNETTESEIITETITQETAMEETTIQETTTEELLTSEEIDEIVFTETNEIVTAKNTTNLRSLPSQADDSNIIDVLYNGETATQIGINENGWAKLEYNGIICYAVSSYLTTDLNATVEVDDGINTVFTKVEDVVTAKIQVNLRSIPSVTNVDSQIIAVLNNGETINRTGIAKEQGWSRVEYNGEILYCISSYLEIVE